MRLMTQPQIFAGTDVLAFVLLDLGIILVAARLVGSAFIRFGQPRVVGEIIAGILIGPTVLGGHLAKAAGAGGDPAAEAGSGLVDLLYPLQAFSFLNIVGQIGLVFFMFLVGLELDQRLLKGRGRQIAVLAVSVVIAPVILGFLVAAVLSAGTWKPEGAASTAYALLLGAALSVTAFPVMARILQEKGLMSTPMGAVGVGAAAVVTVLMFFAIAAASATAKGTGPVTDVGLRMLLTVALVAVLLLVVRPLMGRVIAGWQPGQPISNRLAVMLILALLGGLAADRIGINALVGGFLAGLAVPVKPGLAETVAEHMEDMVVLFFLPVFLAVSGLRTDLKLLTLDLIPGLLLFLATMIVGKWVVGYASGRFVGLRSHQANTLGVLLNCRGLLILVVGLIGLQLGLITGAMQAVFVVGAIVTTLMTGPLVDVFVKNEPVPADADRTTSGVAVIGG
jgi:Kef-type K+ transport system membrane component KefB